MTDAETANVLGILRAAYPNFYRGMTKKQLDEIVDLWASMFEEDTPQTVAAAVKALIATDVKGFPPHIGAVKEKLRQITTPPLMTEQEAWSLVLRAMDCSEHEIAKRFDNLPPVVRSIVGSPRQLWDWGMMDSDVVQSVVASNFMRSYRARAEFQRDFEALPGDVKALATQLGGAMSLDHALALKRGVAP